jgi:pyruvate/2-oxoglutarate dehydrogenase complex dihydrolipoamide dehydrogenase (E3) component
VTLIEKDKMGGDCLNTGCALQGPDQSARLVAQAKRPREFGFKAMQVDFDFADVMERAARRENRGMHDSARALPLGVECSRARRKSRPLTVEEERSGQACAHDPGDRHRRGARPFAADGTSPRPLPDLGLGVELESAAAALVVLGGGPIGCELAQCFARFGSRVTQVEMLPRILIREDPEISEMVARQFREDRLDFRTGHKAMRVLREGGEKMLLCEHDGNEVRIAFDELLCAVGRIANTEGYGSGSSASN